MQTSRKIKRRFLYHRHSFIFIKNNLIPEQEEEFYPNPEDFGIVHGNYTCNIQMRRKKYKVVYFFRGQVIMKNWREAAYITFKHIDICQTINKIVIVSCIIRFDSLLYIIIYYI